MTSTPDPTPQPHASAIVALSELASACYGVAAMLRVNSPRGTAEVIDRLLGLLPTVAAHLETIAALPPLLRTITVDAAALERKRQQAKVRRATKAPPQCVCSGRV